MARTASPKANPAEAIPGLLLTVGLCLLVAAGTVGWRLQQSEAASVDGEVVALVGNAQVGFAPMVQFTRADGTVVRWFGGERSAQPAYAVGDHLRIDYDSDNAAATRILRVGWMNWVALLGGVVGAACVVFAATRLRAARRPAA